MNKELCVIHANCQGDPLANLLLQHPEFAQKYYVRKYTNYRKEQIPEQELRSCSLFLYQHLGDKWAEHASANLLGLVNSSAQVMQIPNMLFKGYWPFWTNGTSIDFGDSFLEKLIGMGLGKSEIMFMYLHRDICSKFDLAAMFEESVEIERRHEANAVVQTVDLVLSLYRTEKLFNTINHPNRRLLLHVVDGVLRGIGQAPLPEAVTNAFTDPYDDFELPIHPQVAAFHSLAFADAATQYAVYGKSMTFEEYIGHYVDCRLHGLDKDFIAYLHLV